MVDGYDASQERMADVGYQMADSTLVRLIGEIIIPTALLGYSKHHRKISKGFLFFDGFDGYLGFKFGSVSCSGLFHWTLVLRFILIFLTLSYCPVLWDYIISWPIFLIDS